MNWILRHLKADTEARQSQFHKDFAAFANFHGLSDWEGWFSPYDEETYDAVLDHLAPEDVVLDIGAGDLRLALRMAEGVQKVYAVEVNPLVVGQALTTIGLDLPRNLYVICANALDFPIPTGVTVAVLLMRHCQHFEEYFECLRAAGCQRLLTNARWKSGLEAVDLTAPRIPFEQVREGWYACRCGTTGYVGTGAKPGGVPIEVSACPACSDM